MNSSVQTTPSARISLGPGASRRSGQPADRFVAAHSSNVPDDQRWCIWDRRRGRRRGAPPDPPAVPARARRGQPADRADGGGTHRFVSGRGWILLLGQGSVRFICRIRRSLSDHPLYRRRYGDLPGFVRFLPNVSVSRWIYSSHCDGDRDGLGMRHSQSPRGASGGSRLDPADGPAARAFRRPDRRRSRLPAPLAPARRISARWLRDGSAPWARPWR